MPKISDTPKGVKPYLFHGVDLAPSGHDEWRGDCPMCAKGGKFYVKAETTQYKCHSCGAQGNDSEFVNVLWGLSSVVGLEAVAKERGLAVDTLVKWGVRISPLTGEAVVPGYSPGGGDRIGQLYRYARIGPGKPLLLATPGLQHKLFGANLYQPKRPNLYVCEGPWDGMALWEALAGVKKDGDEYLPTSNAKLSLGGKANVAAVPGANGWHESWGSLCAGKDVALLYDNDHPRKNPATKSTVDGAGIAGVKRVAAVLSRGEHRPKTLRYLAWGGEGKEFDASLVSGYDVRDLLKDRGKCKGVAALLSKLSPVPPSWVPEHGAGEGGVPEIKPKDCTSWNTLVAQWEKAMSWGEGLDRALSVMLASCASVRLAADQLWVKIISPPSGGKTSLCEGIAVAKDHVLSRSVIRGFHSGFQTDGAAQEDHSLLARLRDKTLVTKDGDTLLQSPNLPQILSEARDIYDRNSSSAYRNKSSRDYYGVNMTWILCGTSSLRLLDASELGERFLDCVIMDSIDTDLERDINRRKISMLRSQMANDPLVNGRGADDPETAKAKALTGGYVNYLRENVGRLVSRVTLSAAAEDECIDLGTFVAYMRCRPPLKQDEETQRELSARLVSQLTRLGYCLAVVLNKESVDAEVMRRVRRVALDTARGRTLEICRVLYSAGEGGADSSHVVARTRQAEEKQRSLLRFLERIGAVESSIDTTRGLRRTMWSLVPYLRDLYSKVVGE